MTGASLSYRKGLALLNRLLRREPESEVKFRTYLDFCQKAGKKAEESAAREAEARLRAHGFDPESGKPRSSEDLPPELREGAKPEENGETIAKAIEKINAGRPLEDEQVKASQTEAEKPEETVYISADDVGVRHQKERRVAEYQKDGAFVWSTNALVQSCEGERIFTCVGMKKAFLFVLAYLLDKGILRGRIHRKIPFWAISSAESCAKSDFRRKPLFACQLEKRLVPDFCEIVEIRNFSWMNRCKSPLKV